MFKKITQYIQDAKSVVICTHINADGDTICSALALKEILENYFNKKTYISGEKYPIYFDRLEKNSNVSDEIFNESLIIVLDATSKNRIFDKRVITESAIKIDHHPKMGDWLEEVVDTNSPATGQLIYQFAKELDYNFSSKFKEYIFISIWTDTDGMLNRNITNTTKSIMNEIDDVRIRALENIHIPNEISVKFQNLLNDVICKNNKCTLFVKDDFKKDYVRFLVAYIYKKAIYESSDNLALLVLIKINENEYLGELRSKPNFDVSKLAVKFGGGGHKNSSGFKCNSDIEAYEIIAYFEQKY